MGVLGHEGVVWGVQQQAATDGWTFGVRLHQAWYLLLHWWSSQGNFTFQKQLDLFFFFRCSIWAVSLSFFKSPKSRVIQCTSLGLVAFACGAFVKNVSIAVDHITAELPVSSLFSSEIYQHSAPCLHASCYCSMVLLPHGNSKIITPHTALLQRDETVSAPQIAATYWITGQHLDYWLSQRIFCSPQGALTRKGSSTSD